MPNITDQDRMQAKMRSAEVVNLDEYRSRATVTDNETSKSWISPDTMALVKNLALIVAVALFVKMLLRR